jgi:hypothetical protein
VRDILQVESSRIHIFAEESIKVTFNLKRMNRYKVTNDYSMKCKSSNCINTESLLTIQVNIHTARLHQPPAPNRVSIKSQRPPESGTAYLQEIEVELKSHHGL